MNKMMRLIKTLSPLWVAIGKNPFRGKFGPANKSIMSKKTRSIPMPMKVKPV
jgi:hypothetical protein